MGMASHAVLLWGRGGGKALEVGVEDLRVCQALRWV